MYRARNLNKPAHRLGTGVEPESWSGARAPGTRHRGGGLAPKKQRGTRVARPAKSDAAARAHELIVMFQVTMLPPDSDVARLAASILIMATRNWAV